MFHLFHVETLSALEKHHYRKLCYLSFDVSPEIENGFLKSLLGNQHIFHNFFNLYFPKIYFLIDFGAIIHFSSQ